MARAYRASSARLRWALCLVLLVGFVGSLPVATAGHDYPGKSWRRVGSPEKIGWSREKLKAARNYAATIKTEAVMIIADGKVLDEWGETARKFNVPGVITSSSCRPGTWSLSTASTPTSGGSR